MRTPRLTACAALTALVLALAAAGCGKSAPTSDTSTTGSAAESVALSPDTPAASGDAGKVTWALYRDVQTLDPIQAFDYPENTAVAAHVRFPPASAAGRHDRPRPREGVVRRPERRSCST